MKDKNKKKPNVKVVILSLVALIFLIFTFFVHWIFIIGAVIIMIINQKELIGKKNNPKSR